MFFKLQIKNTILKVSLITLFYYLFLNGLLGILFTYLDFKIISSNTNVEIINISVVALLGGLVFFSFKKHFSKLKTEKNNIIKVVFYILVLILATRVFNDPIYRFESIFNGKNVLNFFDYGSLQKEVLVLFFLKTVIITPIVEELTFRGVVMGELLEKNISLLKSLIISSILFSLIHINPLSFNPTTLLITLITGIIFGLIFYKYGLIYSIIAHCFYNFLWLFIMVNGEWYFNFLNILNFGAVYWGGVILSFLILLITIKKIITSK